MKVQSMFELLAVIRSNRTRRTGRKVGEKVGETALCFGIRHGSSSIPERPKEASFNSIDKGIAVSIHKRAKETPTRLQNKIGVVYIYPKYEE